MNCAIARRDQAELLSRVQKPHNGAKDFTNLHSYFYISMLHKLMRYLDYVCKLSKGQIFEEIS